jgi:hypothetical protein
MGDVPVEAAAPLAEKGGRMMRQSLFAGHRLRGSYRNVPMDNILALLDRTDEQEDALTDSYYLYRPRLSRRMKEEV